MSYRINLIVAVCKKNFGIGFENNIPWHIKTDLNYFKSVTCHNETGNDNFVIMGRKTYESIPKQFRPLKNRINIVLSRNKDFKPKEENVLVFDSIINALNCIQTNYVFKTTNIFIIGGESIYKQSLQMDIIDKIYLTEIYEEYECDTFFPKFDENKYKLTSLSKFYQENNINFRFKTYSNKNLINKQYEFPFVNKEEHQYLNMLKHILNNGISSDDRTGVGTLSVFGQRFIYNLQDTFPILTTKKMFVRGIFEELMLYISGSTDNKVLQSKKIHIWDGNTSREFLDNAGLNHYETGDMGETYGFNFRHFGATYKGCNKDYSNQGFDQIENAIHLIKNNPSSRRIIINLFNPYTQHKAALPACLCMYQFYVNTKKNVLDLQIYIRSSDFFLANNWNVCTGAFLVHLICNLNSINLSPGVLTVITGDTHIYKNHIDAVKENLKREPKPFPKLIIKNKHDDLREFKYEDIKLIDYEPNKVPLKVDMAV